MKTRLGSIGLSGAVFAGLLAIAPEALAHCDAMDGPVVVEARQAFAAGDPAPTLKWVSAKHAAEIAAAFKQARAVAAGGSEAYELAELWFLETLVRMHREGEGAPYTGLKPAGKIDPAVALADAALASGSAEALADRIGGAVSRGIHQRFEKAASLQVNAHESAESGREFVAAYVDYVHYVEAIHNIVSSGASHAH